MPIPKPKVCPHCDKRFKAVGRQRFCSYACAMQNYEQNRRASYTAEQKKQRQQFVLNWKRAHRKAVKEYNDFYTASMKDYYIIRLLRNQGIEPTKKNIANKKMILTIKRSVWAARKNLKL